MMHTPMPPIPSSSDDAVDRDATIGPPGSLRPTWPVAARVKAFTTTRRGGVSDGVHGLADGQAGGLNLGAQCGDRPEAVAQNRRLLCRDLPAEPIWLQQVHGTQVWLPDQASPTARGEVPVADAAMTRQPGRVLVIQTADCLPVFLSDEDGECIGIAHAGWRGLANGVLEATLAAMRRACPGERRWHAWLGPAIGAQAFEVGDDVRSAFIAHDRDAQAAFRATGQAGKWWADLVGLARRRLLLDGVASVGTDDLCTVSDPHRFYSYRRDRQTGRMASLIWVEGDSLGADQKATQ